MTDQSLASFAKGSLLMREGEAGDCAYIIESGQVEVLVQRGGEILQIGTRGPGSIIGEMAMLDDRPRTATVRALEDCNVMVLSRADFARRLETADPVVRMIMRVVITRYRDMMTRTQNILPPPGFQTQAEQVENSDTSHDVALSALKINQALKEAMGKNELLLYYQPIIDIQRMKIAGFEALMRWQHPEKGMISPGVFIPVAEESGLITELSKWALGVSCDAAKSFVSLLPGKNAGPHPLFVSVNFSVKDFSDGDFFGQITHTLDKHATLPENIHLEITESLLMEAPDATKLALEKCRAHGLSVSIDDFGSGYSSLSYLHAFPIDTLKIDQSFVRSMIGSPSSMILVKSIIGLARNLGMKIIAEGIETIEQARLIRELGCDECQGFWFSRPLPFKDAQAFLNNWQAPEME